MFRQMDECPHVCLRVSVQRVSKHICLLKGKHGPQTDHAYPLATVFHYIINRKSNFVHRELTKVWPLTSGFSSFPYTW